MFLESWSELTSSGHDFQLISRNYSNEMVPQGPRQTSRTSVQHDLNNLRSSMSSSTSSIQNNIVRPDKSGFHQLLLFFRS